MDQEFRSGLGGDSGLGPLMRLQSACQPGIQFTSEGAAGTGRSDSKMAPSHCCWQETSVPHHVVLSIGCLNILVIWQLASPGASERENKKKATVPCKT